MKEVRAGFIRSVYVSYCHTIHSHKSAAGDILNVNNPGGKTPAYTADSSLIKKKPL
ncbi:hypothetical protein SB6411_03156 [Klebsiella spallanzanii]|jgi:hypothetical protein|uniref:Uncharacterized protein n=1 Tax=Klebsiella spallanzanii TaxID=2587528 RepID=A0ABY6VHR1_9ENTR|nr:hypothetical protein SB6419_03114 [Klebsiella spallanzanii]VUS84263.1 hypothetical protein SB6411_03156 [Klebsiella spallanzanii]